MKEIKNWDDVDQSLKELGLLDYEIEQKEGAMNQKLDKIREEYKVLLEEKYVRTDELTAQIQDFCAGHKSDFEGKQTRILNFGEVKFKLGKPALDFLKKEETIAKRLLDMGENGCVKINMKVIKNALKKFSDSTLQKLGIKVLPGVLNWFITPYREKIVPTNNE